MTMPKKEQPPDDPANVYQLLWYILNYEDSIFVRPMRGNVCVGPQSLSSLPPQDKAQWIAEWLRTGMIPCRIRSDKEVKAKRRNKR